MTDRSQASQARDHLERIDVGGDAELAALRATAVDAVDELIDHIEASSEDPPSVEPDTPESWEEREWEDSVESAREKAGIAASKGTLTTKTINGRDYYYLQWRDGDKVRSQYVAPVDPA
ncbi:hypothetical protein EGH22_18370 [Halomicroarcula sp. F28]|uniref:hypothetical protein n=1 Tax=Haloarcula salinisoli TaxID=2487746 RepID=UPI001C72D171|nr:hypothetical protein [Halomicroarcula salinisoli]MBX0288300.1 hypothetical protein [Halomicroarcula salinisoli]